MSHSADPSLEIKIVPTTEVLVWGLNKIMASGKQKTPNKDK